MENLPIDIHTNKLLDWLIDRRHCRRDWQDGAITIRQKINDAIQDMPAVPEITELLKGTYINYFHCIRIVNILTDTEASSRNIFGSYSSKRMKDWQEIVRLYEKDGLYLAEAAQMLMRNVNYEVPSIKKTITKCANMQDECLRKEADYIVQSKQFREEYFTSCKQIGIQGNKIRRELSELLQQLPNIYDRLAETTHDLDAACEYYDNFTLYILQKQRDGACQACLPLLRYMQKHGNTTVYRWKHGKEPKSVEEVPFSIAVEDDDAEVEDNEIDFSVLDNGDYVDLGISVAGSGDAEIDFGDDDNGASANVDFEIVDVTSEGDVNVKGTDGVARGNDAMSILDNRETRNLLIDDLYELELFLTQRFEELSHEGDVLSTSQFQHAPRELQLISAENVSSMLSEVQRIRSDLTSLKLQHLFMIKNSPRYVDRLSDNLKQKVWQADKCEASVRVMVEKREAAITEAARLEPRLKLIIRKTKELQKQIEEEISKKYKNRPVNIMGGVKTL